MNMCLYISIHRKLHSGFMRFSMQYAIHARAELLKMLETRCQRENIQKLITILLSLGQPNIYLFTVFL